MMFKKRWESESLEFAPFGLHEALDAKRVFESNSKLVDVDPTFRDWPISEYENLIRKDAEFKEVTDEYAFYLRKITDKADSLLGYVQLEFNAPVTGCCWIPMLVFDEEAQSKGYGKEALDSIVQAVSELQLINEMRLNVYAENIRAFRFWYQNGFNQIEAFMKENELDREYNCLILKRELKS